jgi:hypothetical protein
MGQFYKGTEATFIDDAMFQLPYELMGKVIDKKDKEVQDTIDTTVALNSLLQAKGLKVDDPRLQEIIGGYTGQIDDLTKSIYGDVGNAITYMPKINQLKRQITTDWKTGEVSKIQENLALYSAWEEEQKKKLEKEGKNISEDQWALLKAKKLKDFTGTNYKDPLTYNTFEGEALLGATPEMDFIDGIFKEKVGSLKSVSWDKETGNWRVQGERGTAGFTEDELRRAYKAAVIADPERLKALMQKNQLGVPGYQAPLFDNQGQILIDSNQPNVFYNGLKLAKEKYGLTDVKKSDSTTLSEQGKQEYAWGIKQRDEEPVVGFNFQDTEKHDLTYDYKTYAQTKADIIAQKNSIFGTMVQKLQLKTKDQIEAFKNELARGDYSRVTGPNGILDGASYVEQFKDVRAKQVLQEAVEADFKAWKAKQPKNAKGEVIITVVDKNGKATKKAVNPKNAQGQEIMFNRFSAQPGFVKERVDTFSADNTEAGIDAKTTKAIGKTLNSLKGTLSISLHTAKDQQTVFKNQDGENVRLVTGVANRAGVIIPKNVAGLKVSSHAKVNGYTVYEDAAGNFVIPALSPEGKIQAQNLVNLGLAQGLEYSAGAEGDDEGDGEEPASTTVTGMVINGKKENLTFHSAEARLVDKNVGGKPVFAIPVKGGNFSVVATVDANTIQEPHVQNWINSPARIANAKYVEWKKSVPPTLPATTNKQAGYTIGKSPKLGWYVVTKSGQQISAASAGKTEAALEKLYYDAVRY